MKNAYIDCLDPRALQWKMFTVFFKKEKLQDKNSFP